MDNFAYIGNDNISAEFLHSILQYKKPKYIITGDDRIAGRGKKLIESPLAIIAKENNIPFYKTNNCNAKDFINSLPQTDYFLVFSFGYYMSTSLLNVPNRMSVNIHPSLLPKYRGAAPINRVVINGEKETGITFYKMIKEMDAGPIIIQKKIPVENNTTSIELKKNLINLAKEVFLSFDWNADFSLINQNDNNATYAPKIDKKELKIDFSNNANIVNNKINGLAEYGVKAFFRNKLIKIRQSILFETHSNKQPGSIEIKNKSIIVYCKKGSIQLKQIQPSGKNILTDKEFLNGYKIKNGEKLCAESSE